jgi:predicted amidohydrolase
MDKVLVACVQQRMSVFASHEEFEAQVRRFMRLAQSKAAQLVVLPELVGLMLAPPLFSGVKLGFMRQVSQGKQPGAGPVQRGVKRVAEAATDVLGGYRGSLSGLMKKKSDSLWMAYSDLFGRMAREFGMVVVGGSVFVHDADTGSTRNRACVFDVDGKMVGYQDKLNLSSDEQELVEPGSQLAVVDTRFGRLGLLIGWDVLYPELPRALVAQGAEVLIGLAAGPGAPQGQTLRAALAMRTEENQVYSVASFLIGPNYLGKVTRDEYMGQSAVLAPTSLTDKGSGVLVQMGTNRTEGLISTSLDYAALRTLWQTSNFRPRQQMVLADAASVLADLYNQGRTIDEAAREATEPLVPEPPAEPKPSPSMPEPEEPASAAEGARFEPIPVPPEDEADEAEASR